MYLNERERLHDANRPKIDIKQVCRLPLEANPAAYVPVSHTTFKAAASARSTTQTLADVLNSRFSRDDVGVE